MCSCLPPSSFRYQLPVERFYQGRQCRKKLPELLKRCFCLLKAIDYLEVSGDQESLADAKSNLVSLYYSPRTTWVQSLRFSLL